MTALSDPLVAPRQAGLLTPTAFAVLFALALCPILFVDIPAALDYPNHLARMSVLARDGTAAANPYYQAAWGLFPNLAMDLIVPPAARLLGVEAATRLFYLLSQILVVTGAVALERAVKGRFEIAGFMALLYLYSVPFAWGFVNFQFGFGLALWGIAAWVVLRERPLLLRLAAHSVAVAVLFIAHLFALGLYGLTLGLYELHNVWQRCELRRALPVFAVLAAPALGALAVLLLTGDTVAGKQSLWLFAAKPRQLLALNGYSLWLSLVLTSALAVLVYWLAKRGALVLQGAGAFMVAGFAITFVLIPFGPMGTAFADVRVTVAAAFILPAFLTLQPADARTRRVAGGVMTSLILATVAMAAVAQASYRRPYAEIIRSFALLERNPRLLVVARDDATDPPRSLLEYPMVHAPVLAVHYANAFVPSLFTYIGQQPILPRPSVWHLAFMGGGMEGGLERIGLLAQIERRAIADAPAYLRNWRRDFDYVYVVGGLDDNPLPGILDEAARGERFTAYRIRRP